MVRMARKLCSPRAFHGARGSVPGGFRFQKVSGIDSKKAAFELRDSGAAFGVIAKIKLI